jgi:hypothetical protein
MRREASRSSAIFHRCREQAPPSAGQARQETDKREDKRIDRRCVCGLPRRPNRSNSPEWTRSDWLFAWWRAGWVADRSRFRDIDCWMKSR